MDYAAGFPTNGHRFIALRDGPSVPRRVPIHPALRRPLGSPTPPSAPVWPLIAMALVALYAAASAELSGDDTWALALLITLPVAALAYDFWARHRRDVPPRHRHGRIIADRRPVLMRPLLVLSEPRPPRIIGRVPRTIPGRGGRGRIVRRQSRD
jgi:hypothetical protein